MCLKIICNVFTVLVQTFQDGQLTLHYCHHQIGFGKLSRQCIDQYHRYHSLFVGLVWKTISGQLTKRRALYNVNSDVPDSHPVPRATLWQCTWPGPGAWERSPQAQATLRMGTDTEIQPEKCLVCCQANCTPGLRGGFAIKYGRKASWKGPTACYFHFHCIVSFLLASI